MCPRTQAVWCVLCRELSFAEACSDKVIICSAGAWLSDTAVFPVKPRNFLWCNVSHETYTRRLTFSMTFISLGTMTGSLPWLTICLSWRWLVYCSGEGGKMQGPTHRMLHFMCFVVYDVNVLVAAIVVCSSTEWSYVLKLNLGVLCRGRPHHRHSL